MDRLQLTKILDNIDHHVGQIRQIVKIPRSNVDEDLLAIDEAGAAISSLGDMIRDAVV